MCADAGAQVGMLAHKVAIVRLEGLRPASKRSGRCHMLRAVANLVRTVKLAAHRENPGSHNRRSLAQVLEPDNSSLVWNESLARLALGKAGVGFQSRYAMRGGKT